MIRFVSGLMVLLVIGITTLLLAASVQAAPSTTKTINFQGRLLSSSGGVVPDGHYNMQFKIYQDGTGEAAGNPGGTLEWTESHINNGGTNGVQVRNGMFSVRLGSVTTFGSSVDWDEDALWLSMNVAGTSTSCTTFGSSPCTADGEMLPMKRITATPYALNSGAVGGKTAEELAQLGQGVQTDASSNSSLFINKTGSGNLLQLQSSGTDAFMINNAGTVTLGSAVNQEIGVAQAASGEGKALTVQAGDSASGSGLGGGDLVLQGGAGDGSGTSGDVIVKANGSNSTGTFQVQDVNSNVLLNADTTDMAITVKGSINQTNTKLSLKGSLATGSNYYAREMDVVGNYTYMIGQSSTGPLTIIDTTNPTNPVVVGSLSDSLLNVGRDIRVNGRYAYIATLADRVIVVDISNPFIPVIVGNVQNNTLLDQAHGLDVQGRYAYVAATNGASGHANGYLTVVDLANPASPKVVGSLNHTDLKEAKQVDVNGKYAYVTSGDTNGGLIVVDISNPTNPTYVSSVISGSYTGSRDIIANGRYAYMASSGDDALTIFDISNPATPTQVGYLSDSTNMEEPYDVTLNGRYAYVASNVSNNVSVVDIANKSNPTLVPDAGYSATGLAPMAAQLNGRYLYVNTNDPSTSIIPFRILDTGGASFMATDANSIHTHTLQVEGTADFADTLNVGDSLNVGQGGIKTDGSLSVKGGLFGVDASQGIVRIANTSDTDLFVADTNTNRIQIGSATADGTGTVLVLDTKNTAGDPTGVNGATYYNSNLAKFRCYENNMWRNCNSPSGTPTTKTANYTAVDGDFVLANSSSGSFVVTLPAPAPGATVSVKKVNSGNSVTVTAGGGVQIDNLTSDVITTQWYSQDYFSDGTKWYRI